MLKKIALISLSLLVALGVYSYAFDPAQLSINELGSSSSFDVVVAGAGTGGIAAAIQAARQGSNVLLIEETDLLGGQIGAAGVTSTDIGFWQWNSGISAEYIAKVKQHYSQKGLSPSTCYFIPDSVCPEPHVARQILSGMIASEPKITLVYNTKITRVNKSGAQITSVELSGGNNVATKLVIDATEYGDILPLAGADYRLGNTNSTSPSPSACIQDITYLAVIKKYPSGLPSGLQITSPPPGYTDAIKQKFADIVTTGGSTSFNGVYPYSVQVHNEYRGMPNSSLAGSEITKTGVNWANDYAIPSAYNYLENPATRQTTNCDAKLHTIQFLYYLQHDLGQTNWSVATDEGYDTPYNRSQSCTNIPSELKAIEYNLPVIPYVRESRRLVGLSTLTAKDIVRSGTPRAAKPTMTTSIAVGDYHTDLHNCNIDSTLESDLESKSDKSDTGPFQIPISTLISRNVDGLIGAEKNISVSRLVNGATRLQPITMATGQAAGAIAALAAKHQLRPRDVHPALVQTELLNRQSILFPAYDLTPSHPLFRQIQLSLLNQQILPNPGLNFAPDQRVTKTDLAIALMRAKYGATYVPTSRVVRYSDVPGELWSSPWINQLSIDGIATACEPSKFCPDQTITRADLAIMLGRTKYGTTTPSYASSAFNDLPISSPAGPWAMQLYSDGVTSGCSSSPLNFCPSSQLVRQELAVFLANAFPPSISQATNNPTPTPSTEAPTKRPGDLNGDGSVNLSDYSHLVLNYGKPFTLVDFSLIVANYNR